MKSRKLRLVSGKDHAPKQVVAGAGGRMKSWRERHGYSLADLGRLIGCSATHLSQIENGRSNLGLVLFRNFCQQTSAPMEYILLGEDVPDRSLDEELAAEAKAMYARFGKKRWNYLVGLTKKEANIFFPNGATPVELLRARRETARLRAGLPRRNRPKDRRDP